MSFDILSNRNESVIKKYTATTATVTIGWTTERNRYLLSEKLFITILENVPTTEISRGNPRWQSYRVGGFAVSVHRDRYYSTYVSLTVFNFYSIRYRNGLCERGLEQNKLTMSALLRKRYRRQKRVRRNRTPYSGGESRFLVSDPCRWGNAVRTARRRSCDRQRFAFMFRKIRSSYGYNTAGRVRMQDRFFVRLKAPIVEHTESAIMIYMTSGITRLYIYRIKPLSIIKTNIKEKNVYLLISKLDIQQGLTICQRCRRWFFFGDHN